MINKKGLLIGGGVALIAAYLLLSAPGADGNGGVVEAIKARAGGIVGTTGGEGGATPQNVYNFPAETFTGFPQEEGFDLSGIFGVTPTPTEAPTETPDRTAAKKDLLTYEQLSEAYDVHYGTYVSKGYEAGDIAHERGKKEELMNIMELQSHPTLMHDPTGRIVKRPKRTGLPTGAEPVVAMLQRGAITRFTGDGKTLPSYVKPSTPVAYAQLRRAGYDVSAYTSSFSKSGAAKKVVSTGGGSGGYTSIPGKSSKKKVISSTHTSYRGECA